MAHPSSTEDEMEVGGKQVDTSNTGAICGGVVKESEFWKEPMGYMMAWIMPDKQFKLYVTAKDKGDEKIAKQLFDKYAWSAV